MIDREAELGTGENFEPDADEQDRIQRLERAARAGPDELAGVIEENIQGLADQFETRMTALVRELVGELPAADGQVRPQTFVRGAVFGAIVLAAGVLLGRRH